MFTAHQIARSIFSQSFILIYNCTLLARFDWSLKNKYLEKLLIKHTNLIVKSTMNPKPTFKFYSGAVLILISSYF